MKLYLHNAAQVFDKTTYLLLKLVEAVCSIRAILCNELWGLARINRFLFTNKILRCDRVIKAALKLFHNLR